MVHVYLQRVQRREGEVKEHRGDLTPDRESVSGLLVCLGGSLLKDCSLPGTRGVSECQSGRPEMKLEVELLELRQRAGMGKTDGRKMSERGKLTAKGWGWRGSEGITETT